MQKMKFFVDTHDQANGTFPQGISKEDFAGFYKKYEAACEEEGVVSLRVHVGFEAGRAFCLNMAPDADASGVFTTRSVFRSMKSPRSPWRRRATCSSHGWPDPTHSA
ncbi:nickel-binding protein [Methyloceanibacter stevinii]|uniref:nickel-binding protein n=1 Tax=Methyloceanibacter stevinii TaxID=1774970 RepID=UPI0019D38CE9|nr:nickel-binding protein [Methyloceanibacter stevinii]